MTFWMKDRDNFIFLPYDPKIVAVLRIRDFKYLSDSHDFTVPITEPEILLAKKPLKIDIDVAAIPKSAKPGGRMFYQFDLYSSAFHITEYERSGFLNLKDYKEPRKSLLNDYVGLFTAKTLIAIGIIILVIAFLWYRSHRRRKLEQLIYDEAHNH